MASDGSVGGMFRQSKNFKGRGKATEGGLTKPLPPPVSSKDVFRQKADMEASGYSEDHSPPANGAHSTKEEDHFGFLYSMSERDLH